jgi:hypothetical protein
MSTPEKPEKPSTYREHLAGHHKFDQFEDVPNEPVHDGPRGVQSAA